MLRWAAVTGAASFHGQTDGYERRRHGARDRPHHQLLRRLFQLAAAHSSTVTAVNSAESVLILAVSIPYGAVGSRTPTVMTPGDYDGDGKDDITIYRSATGEWLTQQSSNGALLSRSWGAPTWTSRFRPITTATEEPISRSTARRAAPG